MTVRATGPGPAPPSPSPSASQAERQRVVLRRQLEDLRQRLIDQTSANKLITFRFSDRSRRHIPLDRVPSAELLARLADQKPIRLTPAPPTPPSPAGTPPPLPKDGTWPVLLDGGTLTARLTALRRERATCLEERGVSNLYACPAFLYWRDRDDTEDFRRSPLVLLPVVIERQKIRGRDEQVLRGTAEPPSQNRALTLKLDRDARITLPDLPVPFDLDAYCRAVAACLEHRPGWRVVQECAIAQIQLASQVMFDELDPERIDDERAAGLPLIRELVVGGEARDLPTPDPGDASETSDDPRVVATLDALPVVMDADRSQLAAIHLAMKERLVVIHGPPGTGKSQTITNLIATNLEAGQLVLFVAEKQVAVQVVKDNLAAVGLGSCCLELHALASSKADMLAALEQAEARRTTFRPQDTASLRRDREELRKRLDAYAAAMREPIGLLAPTVQALLAACARDLPIPAALEGHDIPRVEALSPAQFADDLALLTTYRADLTLARAAGIDPDAWQPLAEHALGPMDSDRVATALERWAGAVSELVTALADVKVAHVAWAHVPALVDLALSLPAPSEVEIALLDPRHPDTLARRIRAIDQAAETLAYLDARPAGEVAAARAVLPDLVSACAAARGHGDTWLAVEAEAKRLAAEAAVLDGLAGRAGAALAFLDAPPPDIDAVAAVIAASVGARRLSVAALSARTSLAMRDDAAAIVDRLEVEASLVATRLFEVERRLPNHQALDVATLRAAAATLRSAGFLARLGATYRAARRTYERAGGAPADRLTMAAHLEAAADARDAQEQLRADDDGVALAGSGWRRGATDLATARELIAWAGQVRAEHSLLVPAERWVRETLLKAPTSALETLRDVVRGISDETLRDLDRRDLGRTATTLVGHARDLAQAAAAVGQAGLRSLSVGELDELVAALSIIGGLASTSEDAAHLETVAAATDRGEQLERTRDAVQAMAAFPDPLIGDGGSWPRLLTALTAGAGRLRGALDRVRNAAAAVTERGFDADRLAAPTVTGDRVAADIARLAGQARDHFPLVLRVRAERRRIDRTPSVAGVVQRLDDDAGDPPDLAGLYRAVVHRSLRYIAGRRLPLLGDAGHWTGAELEDLRRRFRDADERLIKATNQRVIAAVNARPMPSAATGSRTMEKTNLELLRHEYTKSRAHLPPRELFRRAGPAIAALTPCLMMSPASAAQFLGASTLTPDVLIVDEASQLLPEVALAAISRARRLVVVGDQKQLPPTTFFRTASAPDDDQPRALDDAYGAEKITSDSLLTLALAAGARSAFLRWHYRSRHESLIAFSNRHFYEGRLLVLPSAGQDDYTGVALHHVPPSYNASVSTAEGAAIVQAVLDHARLHPELSLVVVTMNALQTAHIAEQLEDHADPHLAAFRAKWEGDRGRFDVKSLEHIQGDERDVVFVSLTYGKPATGTLKRYFGPVNGHYGDRRLNVLFTRARQRVVVFTSMNSADLREEDASPGVKVLAAYLRYAESGCRDLADTERSITADSPFEDDVGNFLASRGHTIVRQVGAAGYAIDIGVRDGDGDGYLCGVECDGATYHSARHARDRDRLRQRVLESRGWAIVRVWSTDWFRDRQRAGERLLAAIDSVRATRAAATPPRGLGNSS